MFDLQDALRLAMDVLDGKQAEDCFSTTKVKDASSVGTVLVKICIAQAQILLLLFIILFPYS